MNKPTTIKNDIDNLLLLLGTLNAGIQAAEEELAHKIVKIKSEIQPNINHLKERRADAEKKLKKLAKNHHSDIFGAGDRADFPHGVLIYATGWAVKKIRDMLERLKRAARNDLIKIAESPDWDQIDKLSQAELIELGTERKKHEDYEYEITGA